MLDPIFGFFRSFYSLLHYEWVADEKEGLELLPVYSLCLTGAVFGFGWAYYRLSLAGLNFADMVRAEITGDGMLQFLSDILPNGFLFLIAMCLICATGLLFSLLQLAVMYAATLGQIMNALIGASLNFCQLVRLAMHAQIAATVVAFCTMQILNIVLGTPYMPGVFICLGITATIYMALAVVSAKH